MSRMSRAFAAGSIACAILIGASGCMERVSGLAEAAAPSGAATPQSDSLRLVDLDGKPFNLRHSSQGPVRVVLFTRSDCPISNRNAPEMKSLYENYHSKGVDFYLVYVDPDEKPEAIREHLREFKYPCPGICDPQHTLVAQTGATVTPEAVVFSRDWQIAYRGRVNDQYVDLGTARPAASKHDLQEAIEATLAGRPVAEPVTRAIGCYIGDLKK